MAYKHLNTDELTFIESYYHQNLSVKEIAKRLKRSRQTIYSIENYTKITSKFYNPPNFIWGIISFIISTLQRISSET
ncbi:helix-turn-helix domain-containing protein [Macrococcus psychrotolerans]|nr:helix-turn-helix domain-containing protein [Macrococcus caseolyticus]